MENNYLPPEVASTYSEIFKNMICDFNNVTYTPGMNSAALVGGGQASQDVDGTNGNSVNSAAFIAGMHWNYNSAPSGAVLNIEADKQKWTGSGWTSTRESIIRTQMNQPGDYGDVMVVQLRVGVFQPIWGWTQANGIYRYGSLADDQRSVDNWVRNAASTELVYTYYVPCLNFRTITSD